jgi:hypothetical protein
MSASAEFVALCQSQIGVLTQGLGASLAVVYLTEELTDTLDTRLTPIAAYPEAAVWQADQTLALLSRHSVLSPQPLLTAETQSSQFTVAPPALPGQIATPEIAMENSEPDSDPETALLSEQQLVLPLVYEGVMMGLLVTARLDRPWLEREKMQLECIARTLAIACVLDQRGQWLDHDLHQQRLLRAQQHDVFDNLLHQFRNPLTALRTFGKLLMRRLLPGDANQEVAVGIVRESDRLQELLKQFDVAVDLGSEEFLPQSAQSARHGVSWETELETDLRSYLTQMQQMQQQRAPSPPPGSAMRRLEALPEANRDRLPSTYPDVNPSARLLPGNYVWATIQGQLEPCPMMSILKPLLISTEAIAQDRHLQLHIHLPDLPPVWMNVAALREVISNLLDNALKYTPAGGQVAVFLERPSQTAHSNMQPQRQAIVIADTGPGIPAADFGHLFERRYRGVQASSGIPGSGLGLAIAKELITQMQGEIQVISPIGSVDNPFRQKIAQIFQQPSEQESPDQPALEFPGTTVIVWLLENE